MLTKCEEKKIKHNRELAILLFIFISTYFGIMAIFNGQHEANRKQKVFNPNSSWVLFFTCIVLLLDNV